MLFVILLVLFVLFWVGLKITGAILAAFFWLFIRLPLALFIWALGICFVCTLLLIPIGVRVFRLGTRVILP